MRPKRVGANGRPMRGTARTKKKMHKYKIHDKIEKRKWKKENREKKMDLTRI